MAGITASKAVALLEGAAVGDTPRVMRYRTVRDWLGAELEDRLTLYLAVYIEPHDSFDFLNDEAQRTFLLILAQLIEV